MVGRLVLDMANKVTMMISQVLNIGMRSIMSLMIGRNNVSGFFSVLRMLSSTCVVFSFIVVCMVYDVSSSDSCA